MEKTGIEVNGVFFEMLPVEGGHFTMGATSEQHGEAWENENPVHDVYVENFYMGETVVTQALWQAVMADGAEQGSDLPQTGKSWAEWQTFVGKLGQMAGLRFRMPSEAEWEYAARGGRKSRGSKYAGSGNLDEVAWFDQNSGGMAHPVKRKRPNELGLYDMSGNVWEWCADWYGEYTHDNGDEVPRNPQGPPRGRQRVVRGASHAYYARSCRVSCRLGFEPTGGNYAATGLRLVMDEYPATIAPGGPVPPVTPEPPANTPEPPRPNPFGNKSPKPKPESKPTGGGNSHYWHTDANMGKKKKRWPWIVGPIGGFILILLIARLSGKGTNTSTNGAEKPAPEVVAQEKVDTTMINQGITELWKKFEDAKGTELGYYLKDYRDGIEILNEIKSKLRDYKKQLKQANGNEYDKTINRIDSLSQALDYRVDTIIQKEENNIKGIKGSTDDQVKAKEISNKNIELLREWKKADSKLDNHDYVDLGLPSGTLWATCNVGANKPEDYGDYFAWGETTPKTDYDWKQYKHCNGSGARGCFTKYCNESSWGNKGYTDTLTTLEPNDDAATENWGNGWYIPTHEQWEELLQYTTGQWTTQNGVKGFLFTSRNKQSIFLPAAGNGSWDGGRDDVGSKVSYWSSSLYSERSDYALGFWGDEENNGKVVTSSRLYGKSIRPVVRKN